MTMLIDRALRASTGGLAVIVAAGLACQPIAQAAVPDPAVTAGVSLTSGWSGDPDVAQAFVMGATGFSTPSPFFADTAAELYLSRSGFTGVPQSLTTPQLANNYGASEHEGADILVKAIQDRIGEGGIDEDNPIYVFGYSQSAAMSTYAMEQLDDAGVDHDWVRFVMVGNTANPNGGLLTAFDLFGTHPFIPGPNVTLDQATPDGLYSAAVYTLEYDGWADFPRYPLNFISVLNDIAGMAMNHPLYLGLTQDQIDNAVLLPTEGESDVDYYMIRSEILPLLAPVRLMPFFGKALYDLFEPVTRILVNLGYGNIDHGWNDGPANVATPINFGMPDLNWNEVMAALNAAWQQGMAAYNADVPTMFTPEALMDNPVIAAVVESMYGGGGITDADPDSWMDLFNSIVISQPGEPVQDIGDLFETGSLAGLLSALL